MADEPRFKKAFPYQKDVLALPVTDLDAASKWYGEHFGMSEVERLDQPVPTVILERDECSAALDAERARCFHIGCHCPGPSDRRR